MECLVCLTVLLLANVIRVMQCKTIRVMQCLVCLIVLLLAPIRATALAFSAKRRVSIVTGSNGYVGREIAHTLLKEEPATRSDEIICMVRSHRVEEEEQYWEAKNTECDVKILPYDMLDGGKTLSNALDYVYYNDGSETSCCVYHVASVFGPTEDHRQTALDNVCGTEDVVKNLARYKNSKLVVTSSMAAVRASGQTPKNGKFYTYEDWNTESKLGENWGQSYQWSKAESERRAWDLAKEFDVPMVSLCPSFVFGPPSDGILTNSFSITLVNQWVWGESPVQSRLCVDIRDIALAHVIAGRESSSNGKRYIISSEARIPSQDMGEALKAVARETGLGDPDKIICDTEFDGGAIKIGGQEVEAAERMKNELGLVCRPVEETMADMGRALLQSS